MQIILQSYGAVLKVNNGMFEVVHKDGRQQIPFDKVKSFHLSKGITVTSDAVIAAVETGVEILFVDRRGFPIGRVWGNRFGSISTIRKAQLEFAGDKRGTRLITDIIRAKMEAQQAMLLCLCRPDGGTDAMIKKANDRIGKHIDKLQEMQGESPSEISASLRGLEGNASRVYFETVSFHLPEKYKFEKRSQHPALDMFNCLLNYSYGILYGKVEAAMIKAGIDPAIGIHHRDEYNKPVFVYDVIERYRIWADNVVISLCMQEVIFIEFFEIENGAYWLNNEGKIILIQAFNDYLDEIIVIKGISRSRSNHIELDMQKLATELNSG